MKSPYPTPKIGGALLRPGVSEMYEDACYLWYALMPADRDPQHHPRLEVLPLHELHLRGLSFPRARGWALRLQDEYEDDDRPWHHDAEGERPAWLDEEMDGGDVAYHLGLLFEDTLSWGLQRGILPGQPFAVYIAQPCWDDTWHCDDPEPEIDVRVVAIAPPQVSLRQLEAWICEVSDARKHAAALRADELAARWSDTRSMTLDFDHFESGYWATLRSRLAGGSYRRAILAQARVELRKSARGWAPDPVQIEDAASSLRAKMQARNPAGAAWLEEQLERLPWRRELAHVG